MDKSYTKYKKNSPNSDFNSILGNQYWKNLFLGCINKNNNLFIQNSNIFLLYGNSGNGKTVLSNAFAKACVDLGYSYIYIDCDSFIFDTDKETVNNLNTIFSDIINDSISNNISFCIFLDDIYSFVKSDFVARALSKSFQKVSNNSIKCIIISTIEDISNVPDFLLKYMFPCHIDVPNEDERKEFFKMFFKDTPIDFANKYEVMAKLTEGFNYGKLEKLFLISQMMLNHKNTDDIFSTTPKLTSKMFKDIVEQLKPPKKAENNSEKSSNNFEDFMQILANMNISQNINNAAQAINSQPIDNNNTETNEFVDDVTAWQSNMMNMDI